MDDNIQKAKQYAVVKFVADSTFSEIPTAWLLIDDDNNQLCWWPPRNSNSALLIANCASPNFNTWSQHEVNIMKYCSSLESARKNAADGNYCTTDDEFLGRGKRQHVVNSRYDDNSDEEGHTYSQSSRKYKKKLPCSNKVLSEVPQCPKNFGVNNNTNTIMQENINAPKKQTISQYEKENDPTVAVQKENQCFALQDIPVIFEECNVASEIMEDFNIKESIKRLEQNMQQLLRMQAASQIQLQDICQRLVKLENAMKSRALNLPQNDILIKQFLPLTDIDRIKEFESLLKTTEEAVMQFKEVLSKTGGNNPKDNIQRSLKKTFTNQCAMQCSWKGLRKNFRVANLHMIQIMKREITARYVNVTESEFETVAAEWLRFAKQRKEREEKANVTQQESD